MKNKSGYDLKEQYSQFCERETSVPLFSQSWWLDAVCANGWDVVLIERNDQVIATMPLFINLRNSIAMPSLTQTMGPWIKKTHENYEKQLSYEKQLMFELIDGLPEFKRFRQNFHYSITNWLPFYWRGFNQTTRYTYVLPDLTDLDAVFSRFNRAKLKNIRRAEKEVTIGFDLSADEFYDNHKLTLSKSGKEIQYSREIFHRIYTAAYERSQGRVIFAKDSSGNLHGALFVVWDSMSAYDLISTIDPDFRKSGASSLLVKEIIKHVSSYVNCFDFEGSMIEGVENSFRQFGARQLPYFSISKSNVSPLADFVDRVSGKLNRVFFRK